jgi:hypothetical protein
LRAICETQGLLPGTLLKFHHAGAEPTACYFLCSVVQKPVKLHLLLLAYSNGSGHVTIFIDSHMKLPKIITSQHLLQTCFKYHNSSTITVGV